MKPKLFSLIISLLIAMVYSVPILAQEATEGSATPTPANPSAWNRSLEANLGMTQAQYSDNWTGGAASGIAWVGTINALAEKQLTPSLHWKNTLKIGFGQTHNQQLATKHWLSPLKSTDQIDLETLFRLTRGWAVDPFVSGRLETQFLDQADPNNYKLFHPMKLSETVGAARTLYELDKTVWNARLGVGLRQLMQRDYFDGTDTLASFVTNDGGFQFDSDFTMPVNGILTFKSKLTMFQALFNSQADKLKGLPNEDYWQGVDINWDNTLTGQLTSWLSMNLNLQLIYDKEVDLAGQFKETLSLGLTYMYKD